MDRGSKFCSSPSDLHTTDIECMRRSSSQSVIILGVGLSRPNFVASFLFSCIHQTSTHKKASEQNSSRCNLPQPSRSPRRASLLVETRLPPSRSRKAPFLRHLTHSMHQQCESTRTTTVLYSGRLRAPLHLRQLA